VARNASTASVVFAMVSALVLAADLVTSVAASSTVRSPVALLVVVLPAQVKELVAAVAQPLSRNPPDQNQARSERIGR
jgi:hypothetical protein